MRTVKLTDSQLRLIDNLLFDHLSGGEYWGNKKDHAQLVMQTIAVVKKALEGK